MGKQESEAESKQKFPSRSNINNISLLIILSFEMKVLSSVIESHGHGSVKSSV